MQTLRAFCRLSMPVFILLGGLGAAGAQDVSPEVQQACTPDAMRLCQQFVPDRAKITACMMRNRRQLSAECLTAMRNARGTVRRVRVRHVRHYRHHD
jgi:Cysteine rich repeat